ncbi:arginine deiminase-related protein [Flavicella marina]|uniref:arginine deiminase-related protein n=1 Tax=Flavicella marina TaxID=1475951 RepID=UPI00186B32EC|nr:arginine deiminase-related protein [Flavicella marina]
MGDNLLLVKPLLKKVNPEFANEIESLINSVTENNVSLNIVHSEKPNLNVLLLNDWIGFMGSGNVVVYPLASNERQKLRDERVLDIAESSGYKILNVIDYSDAELDGAFLEGSSSVVYDEEASVAFACVSSKTDESLFIEFCEDLEFTPVVFSGMYMNNQEVMYSSSVINICGDFILFCGELIKDKKERKLVVSQLKRFGKELIYITEKQSKNFVGEMMQVKNNSDESVLVMSSTAEKCLTSDQINKLENYGTILSVSLDRIEKELGYSIRTFFVKL